MRRLNKEYKLDVCNHIVMKYGTVNRDNPQVIYISGKCWVSPNKEMEYEPIVSEIKKRMRRNIKTFFIDEVNFDNKFILDFDINIDKFSPMEKKFLSFDLYLRQNKKNQKKLKELKPILSSRASTVANNLVYLFKENDFTIEKKKQ